MNQSIPTPSATDPSAPTSRPIIVKLADLKPQPLRWLWPGRIPLGKLTLLVGDPAVGKSLVALDIAARVSAGSSWPDAPHAPHKPGGVVLLCAEDDLADTVLPRLTAAGADLARITAVTSIQRTSQTPLPQPLWRASLQPTVAHLETAIQQTPNCRLLLIDPVTRFLSQIHSPGNSDTRAFMEPLTELAARCRVAVLAVHQARRTVNGFAWQKTTANVSTGAARTVWAVVSNNHASPSPPFVPESNDHGTAATQASRSQPSVEDPEIPRHRLFLPIKSTFADNTQPLACSILRQPNRPVPSITWQEKPLALTAAEILDTRPAAADLTVAKAWLHEILTDSPAPATEILRRAQGHALAERSIRRAFVALGCIRTRRGTGLSSAWIWALPGDEKRLADYRLDPYTEMQFEREAELQRMLNEICSEPDS